MENYKPESKCHIHVQSHVSKSETKTKNLVFWSKLTGFIINCIQGLSISTTSLVVIENNENVGCAVETDQEWCFTLQKKYISLAAKTFRNLRRSEGNFHKVFLVVSKVQNEFEFCECLEGKQKVK